jgi:hypothetical protein
MLLQLSPKLQQGLYFQLENIPKVNLRLFEQKVVILLKLDDHGLEVFNRQSEQLCVFSRHCRELTLHFVKSILPLLVVDICVPLDIVDDVNEPE